MARPVWLPTSLAALAVGLALDAAHSDSRALPAAVPDFAVLERITPIDPMGARETRWAEPGVILTDLVYATRPGFRPLRLDLYRASGATGPRPLIVFLHGGGWAHANPRVGAGFADFPAVLAYVARHGYAVAAISVRLSGEAPFPAPVADLQEALRFLRENAPRLGIDPRRIALWGMSSGAQVAALEAVTCRADACPQALAGWFGVYDLAAYVAENPRARSVQEYLRCPADGCPDDALAAASPLRHVSSGAPRTLLLHGVADTLVVPRQSERFAAALNDAGARARLVLIPEAGHGFIAQDSAGTKRALAAALEETLAFFDESLAGSETPQP